MLYVFPKGLNVQINRRLFCIYCDMGWQFLATDYACKERNKFTKNSKEKTIL